MTFASSCLAFALALLCFSPALPSQASATADVCQAASAWGHFQAQRGQRNITVSAPHGGFDYRSEDVAQRVCAATGSHCLLALGFRNRGQNINVNRPTEGVGLRSTEEPETERAKTVYRCYLKQLRELSPHPQLYVEIHGNSRPENRHKIEVAQVGLSASEALKFKQTFNRALQKSGFTSSELQARIEGPDKIFFLGGGVKHRGVMQALKPALMVELPRLAREQKSQRQAVALALSQSLQASWPQYFD